MSAKTPQNISPRPLSTTARQLAHHWELENVIFHEGTPRGEIYFAHRHGLDVALKIPNPDVEIAAEQTALLHFAGFGAARLLADHEAGFLLERIAPGKPLSSLVFDGKDDEATGVICSVAAELHSLGPNSKLPPVPNWHDRYDQFGAHNGSQVIPHDTYKRAKGLYLEMVLSQGPFTALHGDLHHDNILFDHLRGWVAIDPKGYLGEPAYDFGCLLRNPGTDPRLFAKPEIIAHRLEIIVEKTKLDRTRLLLWAYTQAVLSALWSMEDQEDPARGITTATAIETLL